MEGIDAGKIDVCIELVCDVEGGADFDVFLGEVVGVDEGFADLVGVFGILAIVGVVALFEEAGVNALDGGDGVVLDFVHRAEDFPDLGVERGFRAEEDVAVGMGRFVAVVHELGICANLAVVAIDQAQKAEHRPLINSAEDERRRCGQNAFLDVLTKSDQPFLKIPWNALLDLPDVEIDEAHREHVVGEEGELVFSVRVVRLESVP